MIENDDAQGLSEFRLIDLQNIRFEYNMNILMYICNEEAINCLKWLAD